MPNTEEILQTGGSSELVDCGVIPHPVPAREWPILAVLVSIQFIHILDFTIMMPLGPQFMRLYEITPQQFALLVSIYMFSAGIFGFIAAFIIDHFDRKATLIVLCGGFSVATLLCALAVDYETLLAARAVAGAFGGVMGATVFSIIADIIPEYRRGAATGTVMSSFPITSVIGVPTGLFLAEIMDWRAPFVFLTIMGLLVIIAALRILPPVRGHLIHQRDRNPLRQFQKIFSNANHLVAFILIAMLMFAGFTVIPFISPYMVVNVGMSEADLPYLYFFGGLSTFFAAHLIGQLADRYGKRRIFCIVAILSIIPIWLVTHLSKAPIAQALAVTTLFMVLVTGRFVPAMALITASVAPHVRGSFMSFNSSIQQISAGLATLMAGSIMGVSVTGEMTHFDAVGVIAIIATVLCIYLSTKLRSNEELTTK
ncbi:MAG: MFS transporter [Nitrosomonas sp.]|nr:MFS transporter [Nitrosomonas sp.]MDP1949830.1 MFS transporter [Nitrosomonas sp.]